MSFNRGGGGYGGSRSNYNSNTSNSYAPQELQALGLVVHPCESDIVCLSTNTKIPYFNAPVYLGNNSKSSIGRVDEILGPINQVYFTIKVSEGIVASSLKKDTEVYIGSDKLLPLERFLPKPKAPKGPKVKKSTGGSSSFSGRGFRGGRGGGGGARGGRGGPPRGGRPSRGGFGNRGGRGGFSSRGGANSH